MGIHRQRRAGTLKPGGEGLWTSLVLSQDMERGSFSVKEVGGSEMCIKYLIIYSLVCATSFSAATDE